MISFFLARRYLLASRRDAQVGVVALAAFLGLALGVAALVVSLALLAGFQAHVKSRLLAETPHLLVTPAGRGIFRAADGIGPRISAVPGVMSCAPVVRGRVWISMGRDAAPAEIVGREKTRGLVLDVAQARPLGVVPGETVTLVSSRSRLSPLGPVPIVSTMKITALAPASAGRRAAEASLPLDEARRLFALGADGATGYEVFVKDALHPGPVAAAVAGALGPSVTVTTWEEQNRALVLALRLERIVLFAAVFLIVIVAGLNLAATSAVLAATRAGDAAVLSVLGASPKVVENVFRAAGGVIGIAGTVLGVALGASVATALERFGIVPLPAQLYGMSHAPFRVEPFDVAAVAGLSIVWAFVAASVPARTAARQPVVEALRGA